MKVNDVPPLAPHRDSFKNGAFFLSPLADEKSQA